MMRPDTPETDEDSNASAQQSDARRWRKMWPKIVQTNDAAILKAKAMAKNLGSIGKDLSEVQSSLWKHKANKNMSRLGTLSSMGFTGGTGGTGVGTKGGSSSGLMTLSPDQNSMRQVFVDLEALNRPMSADMSGEMEVVSFKRDFSMTKKRQSQHAAIEEVD